MEHCGVARLPPHLVLLGVRVQLVGKLLDFGLVPFAGDTREDRVASRIPVKRVVLVWVDHLPLSPTTLALILQDILVIEPSGVPFLDIFLRAEVEVIGLAICKASVNPHSRQCTQGRRGCGARGGAHPGRRQPPPCLSSACAPAPGDAGAETTHHPSSYRSYSRDSAAGVNLARHMIVVTQAPPPRHVGPSRHPTGPRTAGDGRGELAWRAPPPHPYVGRSMPSPHHEIELQVGQAARANVDKTQRGTLRCCRHSIRPTTQHSTANHAVPCQQQSHPIDLEIARVARRSTGPSLFEAQKYYY